MGEQIADAVKRAMAGDRDAFHILTERFTPRLKAVGRSYLPSQYDVEDAIQEVWLKVFNHFYALREPERFQGWLFQIMRYHCLQQSKDCASDRHKNVYLDPESFRVVLASLRNDEYSLSRIFERQELTDLVQGILDRMPEMYALVLKLHYLEELSLADISEILEVPSSTIKWRLYQGRALFRKFASDRLLEDYITIGR